PSSFTGTITEIIAADGETYDLGQLSCSIETEDEKEDDSHHQDSASEETSADADQTPSSGDRSISIKNMYSPVVLRLAQEYDIDLEQVAGTGRGGRITRKHIEKIIASGEIPSREETIAPHKEKTVDQQEKKATAEFEAPVPTESGDVAIP